MRRSTAPASGKTSRTTILLPENVDANLDFFCLCVKKSKSQIVTEAVSKFLEEMGGLTPSERPRLQLPKDDYLPGDSVR